MGYQGSETSRVRVDFHAFGDEIGILRKQQPNWQSTGSAKVQLRGFREGSPLDGPSIISVSTSKSLGGSSGSFTIVLKVRTQADFDFLDSVFDDDWVDITLSRHDRKFHVMRGLIDDVRRTTSVVDGATSETFQITGRDFGKVFEDTQIYFNPLLETDLWGGAGFQLLSRYEAFADAPINKVVRVALEGWLAQIGDVGRANWEVPPSLAGATGGTVLDFITFFEENFSGRPERGIFGNGSEFTAANGNIWSFAQDYSDPPLTELYCDLLRVKNPAPFVGPVREGSGGFRRFQTPPDYLGSPSGDEIESDPEDQSTVMGVILRDRPFPSATLDRLNERAIIDGPWFTQIPLHTTPRQGVTGLSVGRSGRERRNAFFASPQLFQKTASVYPLLQVPEWSSFDMRRHGMRRYDITSRYVTGQADLFSLSLDYRAILRDWHCMNHLFLNGTCNLGHGRPDIRIGSRFRILGGAMQADETYYVETVDHSWGYVQGLRTRLGLTRGFRGTDQDYVDTLNKVVKNYSGSEKATLGLADAFENIA